MDPTPGAEISLARIIRNVSISGARSNISHGKIPASVARSHKCASRRISGAAGHISASDREKRVKSSLPLWFAFRGWVDFADRAFVMG